MFITALFTIIKIWKQLKCLSKDKLIKDEVVYIYTIGYHVAIKKNEIMPFVKTWMGLGDITLNEIN